MGKKAQKKKDNTRPPIGEDIKREVRQRCGFGCVICGLPLYEYEHMLGYAKVKRHRADEITLLCDRHHREKTGGLLPVEAVQQANASPRNLREGVSSEYWLHYSGRSCIAEIGSNRFGVVAGDGGASPSSSALVVGATSLVGFDLIDGHLLLSLKVFDASDQLALRIVKNELVQSVAPWDIEFEGKRLKVRERRAEFLIEIEFSPPNLVKITRGHFMCSGIDILVRPTYVVIVNSRTMIADSSALNAPIGIGINSALARSHAFRLNGIAPAPYSYDDREAARRWALRSMG